MNVLNAHQFVANFQARAPLFQGEKVKPRSPEDHTETAGHQALGKRASTQPPAMPTSIHRENTPSYEQRAAARFGGQSVAEQSGSFARRAGAPAPALARRVAARFG